MPQLEQADIDFLMNECRIELTGSSETGIKQALWGVIKEFLGDSESWIERQQLLVTAGVQSYNIAPRDGGQIVRLVGVIDGNLVPVPAVMTELGTLNVLQPITVTSIDTTVTPGATSATNPWQVCFVKNIQLPSTRAGFPIAPRFVLQVYSEAIRVGVLSRMMMSPGKAYTNLPLAKVHGAKFKDQITVARTQTWNQNLQGGQRWAYPQNFGKGTQRGYTSTAQPWPMETF